MKSLPDRGLLFVVSGQGSGVYGGIEKCLIKQSTHHSLAYFC